MKEFLYKKRETDISLCLVNLDENLEAGAIYGPVVRDIYLIESCTGGCGSIVINNKEFPIKEGDTYFLMPGDSVIHKTDKYNPRRGVYCAINGLLVGEVLSKAGITSETPFVNSGLHKFITSELYKIYELKNENNAGAEYKQIASIYNIFGALLENLPITPDKDKYIKKAIDIMETRYHMEIDVQYLADEVGFSRCYFSTLFKKQTKLSPHEYLVSLRIKKACALLKSENFSITEVAPLVGLDPRNFARLFKKVTGKTPHEFIKKKLE